MKIDSLISVIIPIYNTESYLRRCINSVVEQSYKNLEILLVDDGSTDSSPSVCDEYSNVDKRIRVFHTKNQGLAAARNYGISKATGQYLGFVDSDDWIDKNMYEILLNNLKNNNSDVSVCSTAYVYKNTILKNINNKKISKMSGEAAVDSLFFDNKSGSSACNKLYKKELFTSIKFPNGRYFEDTWIMHKIFMLSTSVVYDSRELYYYFQRPKSIMRSASFKIARDRYDLFSELYNSSLGSKYQEQIAQAYLGLSADIKARAIYKKIKKEEKDKIFKVLDKGIIEFCKKDEISKKTYKKAMNLLNRPWIFVPKRWFAEANPSKYMALRRLKTLLINITKN